jgi:hypothetical protein
MQRLVRSTGLRLLIPNLEDRAIMGGKVAGPTPKFPSDSKPDHITLFLVQSSMVNAFATSNRRIYVTRGLLEFVRSDDELAGVLGHEIGHLTGGHHKRMARKQGLLQALGTLGGILASRKGGGNSMLAGMALGQTLGLKYNRQAERDADHRGLVMMRDAGYHPVGMLRFMKRLGEKNDGAPEDPLSVFFSTHPPTTQRAAYFRKAIQEAGGIQAPAGLSFDFSRNLYAPRMRTRSVPDPSAAATENTTSTASSRHSTMPLQWSQLLGEDFVWKRSEIPTPLLQGFPADAVIYRFQGWTPLPEDFERSGGAVLPGSHGLMLSPGATLLGPEMPLGKYTSYLVSCRLQGRGEKVRAFVGLELYNQNGRRIGSVYPASPGIFLEGKGRRFSGVTHPFGRFAAAHQRLGVTARLVVRTGRRGEGKLILEELACLPVGKDLLIAREDVKEQEDPQNATVPIHASP